MKFYSNNTAVGFVGIAIIVSLMFGAVAFAAIDGRFNVAINIAYVACLFFTGASLGYVVRHNQAIDERDHRLLEITKLQPFMDERLIKECSPSLASPKYLDPACSRYSANLAAAVLVWEAMEDEGLRRGKMPMAAMKAWLEENYVELGLSHKRASKAHGYKAGDMNKTAISEVAKISNWSIDGGAPPTPGG